MNQTILLPFPLSPFLLELGHKVSAQFYIGTLFDIALFSTAFNFYNNCFAVAAVVADIEEDSGYASPPAQLENRIAETSKVVGAAIPEKPKVALRNFFPENWLFELINIKDEDLKRCHF